VYLTSVQLHLVTVTISISSADKVLSNLSIRGPANLKIVIVRLRLESFECMHSLALVLVSMSLCCFLSLFLFCPHFTMLRSVPSSSRSWKRCPANVASR
jgi:hypothetical protein